MVSDTRRQAGRPQRGVSARVCPDKSEVIVNGPDDVYMERKGRIEKVAGVTCRVSPVRLMARPGAFSMQPINEGVIAKGGESVDAWSSLSTNEIDGVARRETHCH